MTYSNRFVAISLRASTIRGIWLAEVSPTPSGSASAARGKSERDSGCNRRLLGGAHTGVVALGVTLCLLRPPHNLMPASTSSSTTSDARCNSRRPLLWFSPTAMRVGSYGRWKLRLHN